ncbi:hypothetical protein AWR36_000010 [Microbulbifer flavimaris]|uniref:Uncharacterized protein n=1 Tax=Microbulbifer flavimaris TaxID=1781068 RepID=A0ABX4I283_9GAMM|nr:hypothetical protein AVO43_00010 [Microbulbifer sp. ZGT114]PCO06216.1 hypothetical protein AWR36_000010 [Microbulbifer flavimaris]
MGSLHCMALAAIPISEVSTRQTGANLMMKFVWAILIVMAILMFGRFLVNTVDTHDEPIETHPPQEEQSP